jgi:hypothetical protein
MKRCPILKHHDRNMPQKSKMSKAASKKRPANSCSFVSNKLISLGVNNQDEVYDIDDDLINGFKTDDDGEECEVEVNDPITEEGVAELTEKVLRWRDLGNNFGVRGAGTSERTFYRNQSKQKKTTDAGKITKSITGWLVSKENITSSSTAATGASSCQLSSSSSATSTATEKAIETTASAATATLHDNMDEEFDTDFSIFGILDQYNLFGEMLESENKNQLKRKPMYTAMEAIRHLLEKEAHVTRNVSIENRAKLMAYQRIQAIAILRYLQLLQEGKNKMEASADVAMTLYQKCGIWTYKARSIRGWAEDYMLTGKTSIIILNF